jgi:hypothetical protein
MDMTGSSCSTAVKGSKYVSTLRNNWVIYSGFRIAA